MTQEEFKELAQNNPADAFMYLHDRLEAAELNQAVILGGDGTASDVQE